MGDGPPRGLRGGNDIVRAAERGKLGAVRYLLRTVPGAAAKRDLYRITALHHAAVDGYAELCRVLLAAGAEVDARDITGLLAKDCDCGSAGVIGQRSLAPGGRLEVVKWRW